MANFESRSAVICRKSTATNFSIDYSEGIIGKEHWYNWISFCTLTKAGI